MKKIFIVLFMLSILLVSLSAQTANIHVQGQTYQIDGVSKIIISPISEAMMGNDLEVYLIRIKVLSIRGTFQIFTSPTNFHIEYEGDYIPIEFSYMKRG